MKKKSDKSNGGVSEEVVEQREAEQQANGKDSDAAKPYQPEAMVHLIVFKLGEESYGIRIEQVKEVTVTPSVTRMPRTPKFIKGVANIRGDIIAVMDLEQRFGIRPAAMVTTPPGTLTKDISYTLVIEAKDYSIGVVVKEVPQSLNLSVSKIDKAPSFLQDTTISENYIEGIAKVDSRLIIVLDMFKILSAEEIKALPK
ncbi:chemotaxis protein CheW [Pontibacter silvestris]|uniref:Chemotaxis protein CheW n=1 Tax=Pontibacter silvestris TaxID=2305183 RepID=A0ABW4WYE9_9BACT|nr:chemotaxis protein CheW [Pontibacter silvestris]MCC9135198.1 chemotaxis protein CheW [Pontibacter silvestris]